MNNALDGRAVAHVACALQEKVRILEWYADRANMVRMRLDNLRFRPDSPMQLWIDTSHKANKLLNTFVTQAWGISGMAIPYTSSSVFLHHVDAAKWGSLVYLSVEQSATLTLLCDEFAVDAALEMALANAGVSVTHISTRTSRMGAPLAPWKVVLPDDAAAALSLMFPVQDVMSRTAALMYNGAQRARREYKGRTALQSFGGAVLHYVRFAEEFDKTYDVDHYVDNSVDHDVDPDVDHDVDPDVDP
jgi:hypothetical protein